MNKITFKDVLPQVFCRAKNLNSDIWNKQIVFEKQQTYLIEAESGKGKSTFCSYILGYRNDYSGSILFDDNNIKQFKVSDWTEIRKRNISLMFQELRLFSELTAMENIEIKNNLTHFKTAKQIKQWFEQLGIADKINEKVAFMSFGQQQRVALIRSLCQPFDFLIADEPISHLDDNNAKIMGEIITEETEKQGAGVILTSIGKHIENINYTKTLKL